MAESGKLFVVGTPIGNLKDVSPRVCETLASVTTVLCEDTRVTGKLLSALHIHAHLERCDENIIASKTAAILERLKAGETFAFVSDAGMPAVSDPGQYLVDASLGAGISVEVIPGPSAVTCALVASGLASEHFFFEGFLPRKAGAQCARLEELALIPGTLVIYESPRRVAQTLAHIAQVMPHRRVALVRELTKLHEEVVRDRAPELARRIQKRPEIRGECVVVVSAPLDDELKARQAAKSTSEQTLDAAIQEGLLAGEAKSALAKRLSREFSVPRAEVYEVILRTAQEKPKEQAQ